MLFEAGGEVVSAPGQDSIKKLVDMLKAAMQSRVHWRQLPLINVLSSVIVGDAVA